MFSSKSIPTEAAYIGDELLQIQGFSDLDRKCIVIKQTLQDGDFTLEEALSLYEVSKTDFELYIAKIIIAELNSTFLPLQSPKLQAVYTIEVIASVYKSLFSDVDKKSIDVLHHMQNLSKEIQEEKIAL